MGLEEEVEELIIQSTFYELHACATKIKRMCSNEKRKALIEKIVIIQEKCDNAVNKVEQANECMRMLKGEVRMK